MKTYEFSKNEIATFLRDYKNVMLNATINKNVPIYEVFKCYMIAEKRIQYLFKDYYYQMIKIYEIFLCSKYLTILYDSFYEYLLEDKINEFSIPSSIFVNPNDRKRFSKKQIIQNIRKALNHNDNPNHDLFKIIRVNENGTDHIKIEIELKESKPIPFHLIIDLKELCNLIDEINMANTLSISSYSSRDLVEFNLSNINETINNIYMRKYYSKRKISEEQKMLLQSAFAKNKEKINDESILLDNGMEYRDLFYTIDQKRKIKEELKYWGSLGFVENDVIYYILDKVTPLPIFKLRPIMMNVIIADNYSMDETKSISSMMEDLAKILINNDTDDNPLTLYMRQFGTKRMFYDVWDLKYLLTIPFSIYYGFLFDSLILDEKINITESELVDRKTLRDAFVHLRWYLGTDNSFELYDWKNGVDNEFNELSDGFVHKRVSFTNMEQCAESYFKKTITEMNTNEHYLEFPIHFMKENNQDEENIVSCISLIKNGLFYCLDISNIDNGCILYVRDQSQVQRYANESEIDEFIKELENLSLEEKEQYSIIIEKIKLQLSNIPRK